MDSKIANDDYRIFGDKLRGLRESSGMSQTAFAKLFGMPQQTYQGYESGARKITLPTLRKLANHFGISIDLLVGNDTIYTKDQNRRALLSFAEADQSGSQDFPVKITSAESDLVKLWRCASPEGQAAAKAVLAAYNKKPVK
jgi:transcriptional regulator with XRE-family HTH domain